MRKFLVAVLLLSACEPAGYYVANVYTVNGQLLQERCEISGYNKRPDPGACHIETVTPPPAIYMQQLQAPPTQYPPPQGPPSQQPPQPQPQPQPYAPRY